MAFDEVGLFQQQWQKGGRLMKPRIEVDGKTYCSISESARVLGTTKAKLTEVIGSLEWTQFKDNGPIYITLESLSNQLRGK